MSEAQQVVVPEDSVGDIDFADLDLPDCLEPETPDPEPVHEPDLIPVHVEVDIPVVLDHLLISDIIDIQSPSDYRNMFRDFETRIEAKLVPLKALLHKVIMTQEVQQLESHSAYVDRWRSECTRFLSLATAFVEHGKGSHFLRLQQSQHGGRKMTASEQDSYRRSLTAGYQALVIRLTGLIDDIDARVNLCKKYSDNEKAGFKNFSGRT